MPSIYMPALRVEYAKSSRSRCVLKECSKFILKGELRIGTGVLMPGMEELSYKWRHLCCFTARQIKNIGGSVDSIEGFEDLKDDDQALLKKMLKGELVGDNTIIGRGAEAPGAAASPTTPKPAAPKEKLGDGANRKRPRATAVSADDAASDGTEDYDTEVVVQAEKPPMCPYGASCFRKNPEHFKQYRHDEKEVTDDAAVSHAVVVVAKKKVVPVVVEVCAQSTPAAPVAVSAGGKAKCPHGSLCFRKDPKHFADYDHSH